MLVYINTTQSTNSLGNSIVVMYGNQLTRSLSILNIIIK